MQENKEFTDEVDRQVREILMSRKNGAEDEQTDGTTVTDSEEN